MASASFCVEFPDHYNVFLKSVTNLMQTKTLADVNLVCGDDSEKAHKFMLALFLPKLFEKCALTERTIEPHERVNESDTESAHGLSCKKPLLSLDIGLSNSCLMSYVLEFVYYGRVNVPCDKLEEFVEAISEFGVQGLESALSSESLGSKDTSVDDLDQCQDSIGPNDEQVHLNGSLIVHPATEDEEVQPETRGSNEDGVPQCDFLVLGAPCTSLDPFDGENNASGGVFAPVFELDGNAEGNGPLAASAEDVTEAQTAEQDASVSVSVPEQPQDEQTNETMEAEDAPLALSSDVATVAPNSDEGANVSTPQLTDTQDCQTADVDANVSAQVPDPQVDLMDTEENLAYGTPEVTADATELTTVVPEVTAVAPELTADATELTTVAPELTADATELTTVAPEVTADATKIDTVATEITTVATEVTADVPEVTADVPEVTADVPEVTTDAPEIPTDAPEVPTDAPEVTTDALMPAESVAIASDNEPNTSVPVECVTATIPDVQNPLRRPIRKISPRKFGAPEFISGDKLRLSLHMLVNELITQPKGPSILVKDGADPVLRRLNDISRTVMASIWTQRTKPLPVSSKPEEWATLESAICGVSDTKKGAEQQQDVTKTEPGVPEQQKLKIESVGVDDVTKSDSDSDSSSSSLTDSKLKHSRQKVMEVTLDDILEQDEYQDKGGYMLRKQKKTVIVSLDKSDEEVNDDETMEPKCKKVRFNLESPPGDQKGGDTFSEDCPWPPLKDRIEMTCLQCKFKTWCVYGMNCHVLQHSSMDGPFKCTICDQVFSGIDALKMHILTHCGPEDQYTCFYCSFYSHVHGHWVKHLATMHQVDQNGERITAKETSTEVDHRQMKCPNCKFFTDSVLKLRRHLKADHNEDDRFESGSSKLVNGGRMSLPSSSSSEYECAYCNDEFPGEAQLLNHMSSEHKDELSRTCGFCGLAPQSSKTLLTHQLVKNRFTCKRFKCTRCTAVFLNVAGIRKHQICLKHGSNITCQGCDVQFQDYEEFREHIQEIHTVLKKKVYDKGFKVFTRKHIVDFKQRKLNRK